MSPVKSRHDSPGEHDEGGTAVTGLERRYARWTALFYPANYRRERGSELMDTYLSLAAPGRKRPSPADIADVAAGGLQQHLRIAQGLGPGFRLAGLLALMTATVFATGSMVFEVLAPRQPWFSHVGPFQSLAAAAWAAWLLAAVVHVAASGRWLRWTVGLAVLVTAGIVPAATLTGLPRPPLAVLLPQIVLGVVALGVAGRHPWWVRLMPIAATAATLPVAIDTAPDLTYYTGYFDLSRSALPAAAVTLLIGALLLALGLAARRDYRSAWAMLILLTPIGMLAVNPLGAVFDDSGPGRAVIPAWSAMVVASVLVAVIGPMLVLLALVARGRLSPGRRPPGTDRGRCPTCGEPSPSA
ncbi:hypothetical protein [Micromonospora sp. NPDC006431]|uniref:hypothetical protein n=1 Tax=Micromonospora sp. NPDC006431 TaxID=3364235 RepID=UPI003698F6BD